MYIYTIVHTLNFVDLLCKLNENKRRRRKKTETKNCSYLVIKWVRASVAAFIAIGGGQTKKKIQKEKIVNYY